MKTILFDLDGTLLSMDENVFINTYFKEITIKLAPYGYEAESTINAIWAGTKAMVENDGVKTNEEVFWNRFSQIMGKESLKDRPIFDEFYRNEFQKVEKVCKKNKKAIELIKKLKEKGYRIVLATNPIFPAIATQSRIRWAGFEESDFELYTTYENSNYAKPNPKYYQQILDKIGCDAKDCIMVGNDMVEDMVAGTLGMDTFLVTDCLINKNKESVDKYNHGDFEALEKYIFG